MKKMTMSLSGLTRQSILIVVLALLTACSSAPKRSMQVSTVYSSAAEMIESANGCILTGDYDKAGFFLSAAENQAMSIDCWRSAHSAAPATPSAARRRCRTTRLRHRAALRGTCSRR